MLSGPNELRILRGQFTYWLCNLLQLREELSEIVYKTKKTECFLFAGGFGHLGDRLYSIAVWLETFTGEDMAHVLDLWFSEVELLAVKLQMDFSRSFQQL